jgi:D-glycero-D-manno-heptose 1,7-bisphosphate phosphatase
MTSGVPAVFLDRDGVLIEDTGYPHLESDLRMTPGAPGVMRSWDSRWG